jgi:hypothetical protein
VNAARAHSEWLSLVEVSGPLLTVPVLSRALPLGLEPTDKELVDELRVAWAEVTDEPRLSGRWVSWVLKQLLDLPPEVLLHGTSVPSRLAHRVGEHATELRPDYVVADPPAADGGTPVRMLVAEWPWGTELGSPLKGSTWAANPQDRLEELCRASGTRLGLLTNGDTWVLMDAPAGGATGRATWDAELWLEERSTLDAFTTLLGARRFFSAAANETLEALLTESASAEAEVTDQLGRQVQAAVALLIGSWSRANRERNGALFGPLTYEEIYQGAVTVLMRLVFLLCAEERGLFLLGDPLYDTAYAVSTLRAQLQEEADAHGEDVLERRYGAWSRLLATFRMVYGGAGHENLSLPPYGGGLFDPDRFPWLEGRTGDDGGWRSTPAVDPLPVDDRTVLAVLDALQVLRFSGRGGVSEAQRLSFRALDVQQIGHVYEGLLDHGAVPADTVALGLLGSKGPELALELVEEQASRGPASLVGWLSEQTGLSEKAVSKALAAEPAPDDLARLVSACENDRALAQRIAPYLALLRLDLRGLPEVWLPGSVVMTRSGNRRSSGTYYTPKALAEEMVRYALEPLVYKPGPAEGAAPEEWVLRPANELLDLKVCDPAMGSGAFLVAASQYLAARLLEAWSLAQVKPSDLIGPPGGAWVPLPSDESDREVLALRLVADRCIYGVDRNPMAVEMAKLSLWLLTLAKDKPFSFVDHALRTGDSLLGITSLAQLEYLHPDPAAGAALQRGRIFDPAVFSRDLLKDALAKRKTLESFLVLDVKDAEEKRRLFQEAHDELEPLRVVGNIVTGAALSTSTQGTDALESRLLTIAPEVQAALDPEQSDEDRDVRLYDLALKAEYWLDEGRPPMAPDRRCLHWPLEFPEVFLDRDRPGFDALVGNPPFLGGKRISGPYGTTYREYLVRTIAAGRTGNADLVSYFFLRASQVVRESGTIGLLATNTIAQGDTREVGLDWLTAHGWTIPRAVKSRPWPGDATLEIAQVWLYHEKWEGQATLEGRPVRLVTSALEPASRVTGKPHRLLSAEKRSFIGSALNTDQFILMPDEGKALLDADARNADVVMPYMNGEDLNSRPDCSASRYVINFHDWPLERAEEYPQPFAIVRDLVMPEVLRKVEEAKKNNSKSYLAWDKRWWQFWNVRANLYSTIRSMNRVLVIAQVSKTVKATFVPNGIVYAHKIVVLAYDDEQHYALTNSDLHYWWTITHSATMRSDLSYSPSDCFETLPQPELTQGMGKTGTALDSYRHQLMLDRWEGLTSTYNRVHNPKEEAHDIAKLRDLHVELDYAVAAAYGWDDLHLDHDFWETRQGTRFTVGPEARQELLDRLLELNHERHAEEVRLGLDPSSGSNSVTRPRRREARESVPLFEVTP